MAAALPIPLPAAPPNVLRRLVDSLQERLFPGGAMENSTAHWLAALAILLIAYGIGRFVVAGLLARMRRIAERTDHHLILPALEGPAATFVVLCGVIAALTVVPLWEVVPGSVRLGEQGAVTAVVLWGIACAGGAVIDRFASGARARRLQIAAFLPLIKRTVAAFFIIFSVLVVLESMGFEVKTFLTGLGIGGLAFALAAQDTIANLFGSFVVVMDQPFYVGEYIRVQAYEGTVEEIGFRSTRLRTAQRTQVVIPNKTVAAEVITNYTRMPQRRVDLVIGVTYDNPPARIEPALADVRAMLRADPGVHQGQVVVSLADFSDSSLRVQILYFTSDPDWEAHMAVRQRVNLAILRALAARGVTLSYPSPVIRMDAGSIPAKGGPSPASGGSA
ncbi:MAG TPA: mechanosensitive ion channel domain-containing protein [Opitutaceae bacterium]